MVFDLESVTNYGYLITNEMGVDTENGGLWSFQVGSTGALSPVSPGSLGLTGVAVAGSLGIPGAYVLTTNSGVDANTAAAGGSLLTYLIGAGGRGHVGGHNHAFSAVPNRHGRLVLTYPVGIRARLAKRNHSGTLPS